MNEDPAKILATMSREPRFTYFSSEAKRRCTTCEVDKKRIRGLCKADSGAYPPKDKDYLCIFTCWVLAEEP